MERGQGKNQDVERGQGKSQGWGKIKCAILEEIIGGNDSREKIKAVLTPQKVSTKDVDYHIWGSERTPGLIMKGIVREISGKLTLTLRNVSKLSDVLEYYLPDPNYRRAFDFEFSACFLSAHGDYLNVHKYMSIEDHKILDGILESRGQEVVTENQINDFIEIANKYSKETRGELDDIDKLSYIVSFHSILGHFHKDGESHDWYQPSGSASDSGYLPYGDLSFSDIILAWKDMNLIRIEAKKVKSDVIEDVFYNIRKMGEGINISRDFRFVIPRNLGLLDILQFLNEITAERLDKLNFLIPIYEWFKDIGPEHPSKVEIAEIITVYPDIPQKGIDNLTQALKRFNKTYDDGVTMEMIEEEINIISGHLDLNKIKFQKEMKGLKADKTSYGMEYYIDEK